MTGKAHRRAARPTARKLLLEAPARSASALVHELSTSVTEADIVQVLYRGLQPRFGYDAINLQVLERQGWIHSLAVDTGVLQSTRRPPLAESM